MAQGGRPIVLNLSFLQGGGGGIASKLPAVKRFRILHFLKYSLIQEPDYLRSVCWKSHFLSILIPKYFRSFNIFVICRVYRNIYTYILILFWRWFLPVIFFRELEKLLTRNSTRRTFALTFTFMGENSRFALYFSDPLPQNIPGDIPFHFHFSTYVDFISWAIPTSRKIPSR